MRRLPRWRKGPGTKKCKWPFEDNNPPVESQPRNRDLVLKSHGTSFCQQSEKAWSGLIPRDPTKGRSLAVYLNILENMNLISIKYSVSMDVLKYPPLVVSSFSLF